jgi:hypothetical protein
MLSACERAQAEHAYALGPPPQVEVKDLLTSCRKDQTHDEGCRHDRRDAGNQVNAAETSYVEPFTPSEPGPKGVAKR